MTSVAQGWRSKGGGTGVVAEATLIVGGEYLRYMYTKINQKSLTSTVLMASMVEVCASAADGTSGGQAEPGAGAGAGAGASVERLIFVRPAHEVGGDGLPPV